MAQALPHALFLAGPQTAAPRLPVRGRTLAWAGSAGLHVAAGLVLMFGMPAPAPEPLPVMLLEMSAPEPLAPAPEPVPDIVEAAAPAPPLPAPPLVTAAEPPPPEPPPLAEAPPEMPPPEPMPLAEAPPEPVPVAEPVPEPVPVEAVAELPLPPVLPRPPAPRPVPQRHAPQHTPAQPTAAAPPQPAAPPAAAPAAAAPAPAAAPPANYIAKLFAALERHKTYPQEARYRHVQGVAMLRFRMRRDGTVIGYRLERSAGDAALDAAVLAMIERASPLPAAPAELVGEPIELTVPVRFALR